MIENIPTFPKNVQQILTLTDNINYNPQELVHIIKHDPILTNHILKVVNSAYFKLSHQINSMKEALTFIDLNTLKNVTLTLTTINTLPQHNKTSLNMDQFLTNSLTINKTTQ